MYKELLLNFFGMTEEQVIQEASKINLDFQEVEVFNKGNDFVDEYMKLKNCDLEKRVILKIIAFQLAKRNRGKEQ